MELVKFGYTDTAYFISQTKSVQTTLESLRVDFAVKYKDIELNSLFMSADQKTSFREFSALKKLDVPTPFLLDRSDVSLSCPPQELPPNLETLVLCYPSTETIEDWLGLFLRPQEFQKTSHLQNFRELILSCHSRVGYPTKFFKREYDDIWYSIHTVLYIHCSTFCQNTNTRRNLFQSPPSAESPTADEHGEEETDDMNDDEMEI